MATPSELTSRLVGKMRATAAGFRSDKGIFRRLKTEHAAILDLMNRISATSHADVRAAWFPEIHAALLAHALAEEIVFYAALAEFGETRALALHALEEHHEINELLLTLNAMAPNEMAWPGTFDSMMRMVEQHIEEEEHELFHEAHKVLSDGDAERLEREFAVRLETEKERLKRW